MFFKKLLCLLLFLHCSLTALWSQDMGQTINDNANVTDNANLCPLFRGGGDRGGSEEVSVNVPAKHIGFDLNISPGKLLSVDKYQKKWQKNDNSFSIDAHINYNTLPSDSNAYDKDYGYPTLSLGMRYSINDVTMHRSPDPAWGMAEEVDYDSRLGNLIAVYTLFTRPLYNKKKWSLDYSIGTGIGYARHKYNKQDNIDNELIGSRFLIYFTLGMHATYYFADEWGLRTGVDYYHHSNGALNRPNKGANILGPTVGIVYTPSRPTPYPSPEGKGVCQKTQPFKPYWLCNFALGVGGKTLLEDWQITQFNTPPDDPDYRKEKFHFYTAYSFEADLLYRYARRWSSGIGADLFYGTYADHVKELDERRSDQEAVSHSPWSFGLALKHQAHWHQFSLAMSFGWYLYREMGIHAKDIEKPYYERIGVLYGIKSLGGLSVGFSVKAHATKADFTELTLSYPIQLGL